MAWCKHSFRAYLAASIQQCILMLIFASSTFATQINFRDEIISRRTKFASVICGCCQRLELALLATFAIFRSTYWVLTFSTCFAFTWWCWVLILVLTTSTNSTCCQCFPFLASCTLFTRIFDCCWLILISSCFTTYTQWLFVRWNFTRSTCLALDVWNSILTNRCM